MPKIDRVTGVPVMTHEEFWQKEAEQEGKGRTGADLALELYSDMAAEIEQERLTYFELPVATKFMQGLAHTSYYDNYDGEDESSPFPDPLVLTKVLEVTYKAGFSKQELTIIAEAIKVDGSTGKLKGHTADWNGTRLDPPEHEENIEWVKDAKAAV